MEHHHPRYTKLNKISDDEVLNYANKKVASDEHFLRKEDIDQDFAK